MFSWCMRHVKESAEKKLRHELESNSGISVTQLESLQSIHGLNRREVVLLTVAF